MVLVRLRGELSIRLERDVRVDQLRPGLDLSERQVAEEREEMPAEDEPVVFGGGRLEAPAGQVFPFEAVGEVRERRAFRLPEAVVDRRETLAELALRLPLGQGGSGPSVS